MPERRGVWKPRASKYFWCSFTVGEKQFRGSTKSTRRSEALAFADALMRAEFRRPKAGDPGPKSSNSSERDGPQRV